MHKQSLSFVLAILLAIPLITIDLSVNATPAHAEVTVRQCQDENVTLTGRSNSGGVCVNGTSGVRVRGYAVATCLPQVYAGGPNSATVPYFERDTCSKGGRYIQAERIAQARFIQWLNSNNIANWGTYLNVPYASSGDFQVHPGAMWEVTTSNAKRADVINYRPEHLIHNVNPALKEMELWELKTSAFFATRIGAGLAAQMQAQGYVEKFKQDSPRDPTDPSEGSRWNGLTLGSDSEYTDRFVIRVQTCEDKKKPDYERHYDYVVSGGGNGEPSRVSCRRFIGGVTS